MKLFPCVHITKTLVLRKFEKFLGLFNYIFDLMLVK
jgi:hypothetical protein